jgi:hypothetical protein
MRIKSNVHVLQIYLIAQVNSVFPVIYPGSGTVPAKNVRVVEKTHTSTPRRNHALLVQSIGHYGMETNVFHVQRGPTIIQQQQGASFVLRDLLIANDRENVHAMNKLPFYLKIKHASTVNLHIFGTNYPNHVRHAL